MGDSRLGDIITSVWETASPKFQGTFGRGGFILCNPLSKLFICIFIEYVLPLSGQPYNNFPHFTLEKASRPLKSYHWEAGGLCETDRF